jgi:hypothetical protein
MGNATKPAIAGAESRQYVTMVTVNSSTGFPDAAS